MRMGRKINYFSCLLTVVLLLCPLITAAAEVPWLTTDYEAYAWVYGDPVIMSGPVPPVNAMDSFTAQLVANSSISDTQMYTYGFMNMTDQIALAKTEFWGTYAASSDDPVFQFVYSLDYYRSQNYKGIGFGYPNTYAWLEIADTTGNTILYSNNELPVSSALSTIKVDTAAGHIISVNFGTRTYTEDPVNLEWGTQSLTLNYNTAVAPEPISSILFVTGGTLLAGRKYLRRKA